MFILFAGIIILLFSAAISYFSIKNEIKKKQKHAEEVSKELARGRVIFYSPSSST